MKRFELAGGRKRRRGVRADRAGDRVGPRDARSASSGFVSVRLIVWSILVLGLVAWSPDNAMAVQNDGTGGQSESEYDPLALPENWSPTVRDFVVRDSQRDRDIPIRVFLPESSEPAPVVLFSHGLGGSRTNNQYLGNHWSGRGYLVVFVQHPGSDESVWKTEPPRSRMNALRKAANGRNFMLRVGDIPAVLDQLDQWNAQEGHPLYQRVDLEHVGMSGHSFGAVTTQAVSGQQFGKGRSSVTDARIDAAIAMSPSAPAGESADEAFSTVSIPWLLMTGTRDKAPIGRVEVADRLAVFPALPNGDKYELVLWDAEHSAFSERKRLGKRNDRDVRQQHHRAVLATSAAFWDAYLKNDSDARAWLAGDGVKSVLNAKDRWQSK